MAQHEPRDKAHARAEFERERNDQVCSGRKAALRMLYERERNERRLRAFLASQWAREGRKPLVEIDFFPGHPKGPREDHAGTTKGPREDHLPY